MCGATSSYCCCATKKLTDLVVSTWANIYVWQTSTSYFTNLPLKTFGNFPYHTTILGEWGCVTWGYANIYSYVTKVCLYILYLHLQICMCAYQINICSYIYRVDMIYQNCIKWCLIQKVQTLKPPPDCLPISAFINRFGMSQVFSLPNLVDLGLPYVDPQPPEGWAISPARHFWSSTPGKLELKEFQAFWGCFFVFCFAFFPTNVCITY